MPTALTANGFRFYFYSNEGDEPRHVHVEKGSSFGKIWLEPKIKPAYFSGFTPNEIRNIVDIVEINLATLIDKWNEHFA
jgi:hypothetical protein